MPFVYTSGDWLLENSHRAEIRRSYRCVVGRGLPVARTDVWVGTSEPWPRNVRARPVRGLGRCLFPVGSVFSILWVRD